MPATNGERVSPPPASPLAHPAAIWVLLAVIGAFQLSTMRAGHVWGGDFSLYILHARNLVAGLPYADTGYIADPYIGPQTYPPIFPLFLSGVYRVFGFDLMAMKTLVAGFFIVGLWFIYLFLRRERDAGSALIVVGILGFNPWVWNFKEQVMADIPFLALVFLTLAVAQRAMDGSRSFRRQLAWGVLLGLCAYLAYATRSIGIVLVPVIGCAFLFRTRSCIALLTSMTAVFGLFYLLQKNYLHSDADYLAYISISPRVVLQQIYALVAAMSQFLKPGSGDGWTTAAILGFGAVAMAGFAVRVRRSVGLAEAFTVIYPVPLLLFDNYMQRRYALPLVPLFFYYVIVGAAWLARRLGLKRPAAAVGVVIGLTAVIYGARYTTLSFGPLQTGIGRAESVALFDYVKWDTEAGATLVFFKPRVMALMTGRRSASYFGYRNKDELWGLIRRVGAGYLVIENLPDEGLYGTGPAALQDLVASCGRCFGQTFSNANFDVYRVLRVPDGAGMDATRPPPYRPSWRDPSLAAQ